MRNENRRSSYLRLWRQLKALGIPLPQDNYEFDALCREVQEAAPQVFVEIGTRDGGSLWMLSQYLPAGATVISIDLPGAAWGRASSQDNRERVAELLREQGMDVHLITGDSQSAETVEQLKTILAGRDIDFLFIDGDHTFKGVLRDWELYHPLVRENGMVAFHDIFETPKAPRVKVHLLWRVLKTIYPHKEWRGRHDGVFGIGVIQVGRVGVGMGPAVQYMYHENPATESSRWCFPAGRCSHCSPFEPARKN